MQVPRRGASFRDVVEAWARLSMTSREVVVAGHSEGPVASVQDEVAVQRQLGARSLSEDLR